MAISDNETKLRYIMLTQMKGLGPVTQKTLLCICGDIETCFALDYADLIKADPERMIGKRRIESFIEQRKNKTLWEQAEEILRMSESAGIHVITSENIDFPERFKRIKDSPVVLYTRGKLKINSYIHTVGIVGARRCTMEGKKEAIDIANMAVTANFAVISGMAKGIDSYAHTAVIKSSGYTIAVLGNGVDICYPKEHQRLYEEIAEHGCVLSEYPPGTLPREFNFPKRNRLIAGLSDKLYVIDAGRNSGTLSTVDYSKKYDREVIMCSESINRILLPKF